MTGNTRRKSHQRISINSTNTIDAAHLDMNNNKKEKLSETTREVSVEIQKPLDFTFNEIKNIDELITRMNHELEEEQKNLALLNKKKANADGNSTEIEESHEDKIIVSKTKGEGAENKVSTMNKIICNVVKLSYNDLNSVIGLSQLRIFFPYFEPNNILWLDISYNSIENFDKEFLSLENLQTIYLHGNLIELYREIEKLQIFKKLTKLTLHANPIELRANYKFNVMKRLPKLKSLDFIRITPNDQLSVNLWIEQREISKKFRK